MKVASKENTPAVNAESADELFAVHDLPDTEYVPVEQALQELAVVVVETCDE